ncbi:hypothetical protein KC338_g162 [Hortaea werneckii]|nr:hypothetical protein KC338_g162 [Hortaea werneckii]
MKAQSRLLSGESLRREVAERSSIPRGRAWTISDFSTVPPAHHLHHTPDHPSLYAFTLRPRYPSSIFHLPVISERLYLYY